MRVYRLEASFRLFSFSIPLIEDYGGGVKSHFYTFILVWVFYFREGREGSSFYLHFIWPGFPLRFTGHFTFLFRFEFYRPKPDYIPRPIFCAVIVPCHSI